LPGGVADCGDKVLAVAGCWLEERETLLAEQPNRERDRNYQASSYLRGERPNVEKSGGT